MGGSEFRVRAEQPGSGDAAAIDRILLEAFPARDEADLVAALRQDPAWIPELSAVVEWAAEAGDHAGAGKESPPDSDEGQAPQAGPGKAGAGEQIPVVAHALLTRCHIAD